MENDFDKTDNHALSASLESMKQLLEVYEKTMLEQMNRLYEEIFEHKHAVGLYTMLAESSLAGIFIVQDGKFCFINGRAVAYFGYTTEELIGQDSDIIIHPEDRDMVKMKTSEMLRGAHNEAFEFRAVTKQNQISWISQTVTSIIYKGRPAILGNAIDVTNLRKSRIKLQELRALEFSILASIPHVVLGLMNNKIIFVNHAVESIFGWKPQELIGENICVLYDSESDYEDISKRIYAMLENQQTSSHELELHCRHKNGKKIVCRVTSSRIEDSSDDNKIVATFEDITYQKKALFQLLQSEKMASIGQLAAGVAHEINNPTAFVSSNLKTLSDYLKDITKLINQYRSLARDLKKEVTEEPFREILNSRLKLIEEIEDEMKIGYIMEDVVALIGESREGIWRIERIIQDLKNFAHPGDEKKKAVNINNCIESTLNIVRNEIKYKAVVYKDYGDIPEILGDPQQLNQVFMNILVNAAQAIKEKGDIRIATKTFDGYAEINISDTGMGIPEENLTKLFDPFFTTKDIGKGTGLGLHVAYSIIEKHNGTIEVTSIVNKGTTFTIRLPLDRK